MTALPRPDLGAGPHRELNDALHELHHRAGWPSLRTLAREVGCSHTTVSAVFSSPRLPTWGVLQLLVEAMQGDTPGFHDLWLVASAISSHRAPPTPGIAGRRAELSAVRRHLQTGTGLLLVTGEAGIGKTRLAATAASLVSGSVRVALGPCLPLSSSVPLSPVVDVLRGLQDADPELLKAALDASPKYVAASLSRLLPHLGEPDPTPDDAWSRHRLFLAVSSVLGNVHRQGPLALMIEDLHWADPETLDLLEHLLTTSDPVPVVGTWRTDDPTVAMVNYEWWVRVRRMPRVVTLELSPLSTDETRELLLLLSGREPTDTLVRQIHLRACGQPLFTEQLAGQVEDEAPLPSLLADLLDARLGDVEGQSWLAIRALGVAERPLSPAALGTVCGLAVDDVTSALRDLHRRRLLAPANGREVELRHPLLSDAIRRRMVAGEAAEVHARLAEMLTGQPDPDAGEIARHWLEAGDTERELVWRIAAARASGERFAARDEFGHWCRVLDTWPPDAATAGSPAVSLSEVYVRTIDVAQTVAEIDDVLRLVDDAMRLDVSDKERAEVLLRAGDVQCAVGDPDLGLELLGEALTIHHRLPASTSFVDTLVCRADALAHLGRFAASSEDIGRALELADEVGDPFRRRRLMGRAAWYRALSGGYVDARALVGEAWATPLPCPDPPGDISLSVCETDILLQAGASGADVAQAASATLEGASRWQLDSFGVSVLRFNVCEALLRSGDVATAGALVDPVTERAVTFTHWWAHVARASVDVRRGDLSAAMDRCEAVSALPGDYAVSHADLALHHAEAELWADRPEAAVDRLQGALSFLLPTEAARSASAIATSCARAVAELLASRQARPGERQAAAAQLIRLRTDATVDPFARNAIGLAVPAHDATWTAELGRVSGTTTIELWSRAAAEWDKLRRPHDSAYCRWRTAQAAIAIGRSGVAANLLRRAARDARQHVPLLAAIRREITGS